MKVYTIEEFFNLPIVEGVRVCPTGDYRKIKVFHADCHFGPDCRFGAKSQFDRRCTFGTSCYFGPHCCFEKSCSFDMHCGFAKHCSFNEWCTFGRDCDFEHEAAFGRNCNFSHSCYFGRRCSFDNMCSFGQECSFGEKCSFGRECSFGEICWFDDKCIFEGKYVARTSDSTHTPIMTISGAGTIGRTTYFFNTEDGIIVRSGCFLGTLSEFRRKVIADKHELKSLQYLGFANIVAATWDPKQIQH